MTFEQFAIVGILSAMLLVYASERFRVEIVAMAGLAAAFLLGVVPPSNLFAGFSSPAVITVIEILLIVASLAQTRTIDNFARRLVGRSQNETVILAALCGTAALTSVFMNNVGALALVFPVALSVCARLDIPPARVLMPLSFATLLGGLCSLTGTPANLIVNEWKISETGAGFGYFELARIGAPVAIVGLAWIVIAAPRTFRKTRQMTPAHFDAGPADFVVELVVPDQSDFVGRALADVESAADCHIHGIFRHGAHVFARRSDIVVASGDRLLAEGDYGRFLQLADEGGFAPLADSDESDGFEAVVMPDSLLLGSRVEDVEAFADHGVRVVGLASRRRRIEGRFADLKIGMGDVLILAGAGDALRQAVADCGLLALSSRRPRRRRSSAGPGLAIFGLGILASAVGIAPPELAFGAVVLALALTRALDLRTAVQDLNWPIVILLGCMIPLGMAVEDSGAARVIANWIAEQLPSNGPVVVSALVLCIAVAMTPFIDNVSTAIVLSPIAAGIASRTGVPVEPLLMAVAVGASLDFLTPFGHHNNAVVMGAAGYRFVDFPRFGGPLLLVCLLVGIAALAVMSLI